MNGMSVSVVAHNNGGVEMSTNRGVEMHGPNELQENETVDVARFFQGTGFSQLESAVQRMAIAMVDSPVDALRRACNLRGISRYLSRQQMIMAICEQHNKHVSRCSGGEGDVSPHM